ncbi:hypothetical protein ACLOJK_023431 [Asimina triloba]
MGITGLHPYLSSLLCLAEIFSVVRTTIALVQERPLEPPTGGAHHQAVPRRRRRAGAGAQHPATEPDGRDRRAQVVVEPHDRQRRREELLRLVAEELYNSRRRRRRRDEFSFSIDWKKKKKVEEMMVGLGLRRASDYEVEIERLAAEMERQAGTGGLVVVSNIKELMALVSYSKSIILQQWGEEEEDSGVIMEYQTAAVVVSLSLGSHQRS